MGHEMWGAFTVRDHCLKRAFVGEVLLYDQLVIPVPPDDEPDERQRWSREGWDHDRLDRMLAILGDLAQPVRWDTNHRQQWADLKDAMDGMVRDSSFRATPGVLLQGLPKYVTGVDAVANYHSLALS